MRNVFQAIKRSWTQHFISQFSGFIILFLTYSAVLFIALSLMNIERLFSVWGQISKVTIYLQPKTSAEAKSELEKFLAGNNLVQSFRLVNSQESAERFNSRFTDLSAQKINLNQLASFLPESYELVLNQKLAFQSSSNSLDQLAAVLGVKFPEIKSVSYGKSWVNRYASMLTTVQGIGVSLIFVFFVGTLILSSSVIKTILMGRKDEIEILEFIGANDQAIYLPQIINTLALAALSFGLALGLNYYAFYQFTHSGGSLISISNLPQLAFLSPVTVIGIASLSFVGLLAFSYFTVMGMMPKHQVR